MATNARLTARDLLRFGGDDIRRELVNGRIIEMPPHGGMHGQIAGRIFRRLASTSSGPGVAMCLWATWASSSLCLAIPNGCGLQT